LLTIKVEQCEPSKFSEIHWTHTTTTSDKRSTQAGLL